MGIYKCWVSLAASASAHTINLFAWRRPLRGAPAVSPMPFELGDTVIGIDIGIDENIDLFLLDSSLFYWNSEMQTLKIDLRSTNNHSASQSWEDTVINHKMLMLGGNMQTSGFRWGYLLHWSLLHWSFTICGGNYRCSLTAHSSWRIKVPCLFVVRCQF